MQHCMDRVTAAEQPHVVDEILVQSSPFDSDTEAETSAC